MDREPARRLNSLISQLEPSLAEPVARPLERLVSRRDAGDGLIVAVVGPSGVGKSELINRLAGTRVVTTGPLRPTTTAIAVWGDVDDSYLRGVRAAAAPPLDGVALVDTPPAEHLPEIVDSVLDLVDVALLIVSPDRYADAVVCALTETIEERGVPLWVGLSVLAAEGLDPAEITADVERILGVPVAATSAESADPFRAFLADLSGRRETLVEERDHGAARFIADRALAVAEKLDDAREEARVIYDQAGEVFAGAVIDRTELAAISDLEWEDAAEAIGGLLDKTTRETIEGFRTSVEDNAAAVRAIDLATEGAPGIDTGPIEEWRRDTDAKAVAAMRRRWLQPWRTGAVRDEMWRLAISYDLRPSKQVRRALRDRIPDLRIDAADALVAAASGAAEDRFRAILAALNPDAAVQPEDVRSAAEALRSAGRGIGDGQDGDDA